jgi:hypothetical protein
MPSPHTLSGGWVGVHPITNRRTEKMNAENISFFIKSPSLYLHYILYGLPNNYTKMLGISTMKIVSPEPTMVLEYTHNGLIHLVGPLIIGPI